MEDLLTRATSILVIDDNSPFLLPIIRSFSGYRNIKLDVLLCTEKPTGVFKHSRYLGRLKVVPCLETERPAEIILETVHEFRSGFIIPTREWISKILYQAKSILEPHVRIHPMPDPEILRITEDKWELNHWLRDHGFPYAVMTKIEDQWKGRYPVVVKPRKGTGGEGIFLVQKESQLEPVLEKARLSGRDYFLQEYLEGHDIDFSFFSFEGKIVYHTIQKAVLAGTMAYAKGIEFLQNQEFYDLAAEIIGELGYTGIGHLDFRYMDRHREYVLIDFNARYWSTLEGSRKMGINFPYLATCYTMEGIVQPCVYNSGHYYLGKEAIKVLVRNVFSGSRIPIRLKNTHLSAILMDPKPEIAFLWRKLAKNN